MVRVWEQESKIYDDTIEQLVPESDSNVPFPVATSNRSKRVTFTLQTSSLNFDALL